MEKKNRYALFGLILVLPALVLLDSMMKSRETDRRIDEVLSRYRVEIPRNPGWVESWKKDLGL